MEGDSGGWWVVLSFLGNLSRLLFLIVISLYLIYVHLYMSVYTYVGDTHIFKYAYIEYQCITQGAAQRHRWAEGTRAECYRCTDQQRSHLFYIDPTLIFPVSKISTLQ